jgi:hypothetical protein
VDACDHELQFGAHDGHFGLARRTHDREGAPGIGAKAGKTQQNAEKSLFFGENDDFLERKIIQRDGSRGFFSGLLDDSAGRNLVKNFLRG